MKRLFYYISLLAAVLLTACTSDEATDTEEPLPEGMGRIRLRICTPETASTRAVNVQPWEDPDHDWERLHTFRIFICKASNNEVVQIISGDDTQMMDVMVDSYTYKESDELVSQPLEAGSYYIFATANYNDGYAVGNVIDLDRTVKFTNGYSEANIPMTGKLMNSNGTLKAIGVSNGIDVDAGTITVWRVMAKMQFEFTNETSQQVDILGIEVTPINQASSTGPGVFLFSKDDLTSVANLVSLFPSGTTKTVSATWALNETPTQNAAASVSLGGVFESTKLSWGSKLETTGSVTTFDNVYKLQKYKTTENVTSKDEASAITLKVKPASGMSFTPKNISFKACRVGTDGGKFDVIADGNELITEIHPPRSNGDGGNRVPPFWQEYSYAISGTATTDEYVIKIYLYDLNQKEIAFRDVVISGDITNNTGNALQEHLTLPSGALTDVGPVTYTTASAEQAIAGNGGTRNLFFYVNETDATFTTQENQLSLRFKIQRNGYTEELRYGVTTPYIDGKTGGNGFNVIRRNDWIHIPIHITDWQLRIEPLAFVPIAGYPATTLSSDALTATFSTGGMIALQPFVKKYNDGSWRDFSDPEVTFVSLSWKNSDGTNVSGDGKIVKTPFAYDSANQCIIGELNNSLSTGTYKTTVTVNVKLGPSSGTQYDYSFTFNVVLQK